MPSTLRALAERARLLTIRFLTRLLASQPVRLRVGGRELWLIEGRFLPVLAGADGADEDDDADEDAGDDKEAEDEETDDDEDSDEDDDDTADEDGDDDDEEELSPKVKAILRKERKARRDAERKLRDATRQKPKQKPGKKDEGTDDDDDAQVDQGSEKLRRANLLIALDRAGITGAQAKAAARLLDVEFDEDDEPIDLDDAIDEAVDTYGEDVVKGAKPDSKPRQKKPATNSDEGNGKKQKAPRLSADELAAAEEAGMTPERYAAMKGVSTLAEFEAAQKRLKAAKK